MKKWGHTGLIKVEINYTPGDEKPNKGTMLSDIEIDGLKNHIANEFMVFLQFMFRRFPIMTVDVIEAFMKKEVEGDESHG